MKNLESSQFSKSMTETADGKRKDLISGKQEKIDILFPLFDQISLQVKFPSIIGRIFQTCFYMQSVLVSFWFFSRFYKDLSGYQEKLCRTLTLIFWFQDLSDIETTSKRYFMFILLFCIKSSTM